MLTVPDKVLLAALEISERQGGPFTAEELVVAAWQRYPDTFGLAGFNSENGRPLYPDSNRVLVEIMGSKALRSRGYLRKVGRKLYRLTESGRDEAQRLRSYAGSPARKLSLSRQAEVEIQRLLGSRAYLKARDGNTTDLTFFDACAFWNISPRSSATDLKGRLANFENLMADAMQLASNDVVSFRHGGATIDRGDLQGLVDLHTLLLSVFGEELGVIRARKDERGA
jgi:hypothetical protein